MNKDVAPGERLKKPENLGPTFIPDYRVPYSFYRNLRHSVNKRN